MTQPAPLQSETLLSPSEREPDDSTLSPPQDISVKPDGLPDKFWDFKTGTIRLSALIKSYTELERHLARLTTSKTSPEEPDRDTLLKKLGRPDHPDGYTVQCPHGYFKSDPDLNTRLHNLGFTGEQAQAVYDLAAEKLVPLLLDLAADMEAERELTRIHNHFGGPEKWSRTARHLRLFGEKHLPPPILERLASCYDGIVILNDLMQARCHPDDTLTPVGKRTTDPDMDQIRKWMQDPKYWRDHDPKTVNNVRAGFERLYGEG